MKRKAFSQNLISRETKLSPLSSYQKGKRLEFKMWNQGNKNAFIADAEVTNFGARSRLIPLFEDRHQTFILSNVRQTFREWERFGITVCNSTFCSQQKRKDWHLSRASEQFVSPAEAVTDRIPDAEVRLIENHCHSLQSSSSFQFSLSAIKRRRRRKMEREKEKCYFTFTVHENLWS